MLILIGQMIGFGREEIRRMMTYRTFRFFEYLHFLYIGQKRTCENQNCLGVMVLYKYL